MLLEKLNLKKKEFYSLRYKCNMYPPLYPKIKNLDEYSKLLKI